MRDFRRAVLGFAAGGPAGAAIGAGLGGAFDGGSSPQKYKSSTMPSPPAPTPMQRFSEGQLLAALQGGQNPYQVQQGLANQTSGVLQQLLGYGMNATPRQNKLLEGQTTNYMQELQQYLDQARAGNMSRAQQSAINRGIPLSDMARGQEANVDAQYQRSLAQGYNTAKGQELQNKLQYPMQNLSLMSGLQQQYQSPLMQMAYDTAMSRYRGPHNQTSTQTGGGGFLGGLQGAQGALDLMGGLAKMFGDSDGPFG